MGNNYTIEYLKLQKKQQAMMTGFKAVKNKIFSGLKEKLKSVWEKGIENLNKEIFGIEPNKTNDSINKTREKLSVIADAQSEYDDYLGKLNSKARTLRSDKEFETIIKLEKDLYKLDESMEKNTKKLRMLLQKKNKYEKSLGLDKLVKSAPSKEKKEESALGLGKVVVPLSVQEENNPFKIFVEDTLKKQAQQAEKLNQQNEQLKPAQEKQETEHYTQEEKTEIHKLLFEMQIKRIAELETENELLKKDANNQREALNKEREKKQRETKKEIESLITTKKNLTVEIENEKKEKEKLKKQLNYAKDLIDKFVCQNEELIKEIEQNNQNLNQNEGQQR